MTEVVVGRSGHAAFREIVELIDASVEIGQRRDPRVEDGDAHAAAGRRRRRQTHRSSARRSTSHGEGGADGGFKNTSNRCARTIPSAEMPVIDGLRDEDLDVAAVHFGGHGTDEPMHVLDESP